jgi:hypothetical protein
MGGVGGTAYVLLAVHRKGGSYTEYIQRVGETTIDKDFVILYV